MVPLYNVCQAKPAADLFQITYVSYSFFCVASYDVTQPLITTFRASHKTETETCPVSIKAD